MTLYTCLDASGSGGYRRPTAGSPCSSIGTDWCYMQWGCSVRGEPVYDRDLSEHRAISWLGPNWVQLRVQEIDNIVVNQDISHCDKTSLGI